MSKIFFAPYPIPAIVEQNKDGYLLYVQSGEQYSNDIWTIVHREGGLVRHYLSSQVLVASNATFSIQKQIQTIDDNTTNP